VPGFGHVVEFEPLERRICDRRTHTDIEATGISNAVQGFPGILQPLVDTEKRPCEIFCISHSASEAINGLNAPAHPALSFDTLSLCM
jgi:hypothetical protein